MSDLSFEGFIDNPPVIKKSGRPRGAKNKRTEMLRRYLASKGKLPVDVLAGLYLADDDILDIIKSLAVKLGIPRLEALKAVKSSAESLMKYTEQELPKQVDFTGDAVLPLLILDGGSSYAPDGTITPIYEDGTVIDIDVDGRMAVPTGGNDV